MNPILRAEEIVAKNRLIFKYVSGHELQQIVFAHHMRTHPSCSEFSFYASIFAVLPFSFSLQAISIKPRAIQSPKTKRYFLDESSSPASPLSEIHDVRHELHMPDLLERGKERFILPALQQNQAGTWQRREVSALLFRSTVAGFPH